MPGTSASQEASHKANVAASENTKQNALAAAKAAYNNTPAAYPAYAAAVLAADVAHLRAVISSAAAIGIDGPRQTLFWESGSWT